MKLSSFLLGWSTAALAGAGSNAAEMKKCYWIEPDPTIGQGQEQEDAFKGELNIRAATFECGVPMVSGGH